MNRAAPGPICHGVASVTISHVSLGAHSAATPASGDERRARLSAARLYLIVEATPGGEPAAELVGPALDGGVDVVQLRDKATDDMALLAVARELLDLCGRHGALLILNDRPDLTLACGADGVHLGQGDASVDEARAVLGGDALIGVSTHSPAQIAAARESLADYLGVGPVHATPTKPGVEPVGEALVAHAASHAGKPFFAIGGIGPANVADVVAAGAERVAVVRAIGNADDPRGAAAALRRALEEEVHSGAAA